MFLVSKNTITSVKTGVHLLSVADVQGLKDNTGQPLRSQEGETGIVITYASTDGSRISKTYWCGKERQKLLDADLWNLGLSPEERPCSKDKIIGWKVWCCVREEREVTQSGEAVKDHDGTDKVTYRIFKTIASRGLTEKPVVAGDPERNGGMPTGDFLLYKSVVGAENNNVPKAPPSLLSGEVPVF